MQTLIFDKDGVGNCFEACLASIFDLELSEIPLFKSVGWFPEFYNWLRVGGYEFQGTLKPEDVLSYDKGIDGYFIVAGESPRGRHIKGGHAVVFKDGKIVHDPHPDGTGIVNIKYGMAIERICVI
jgi:hypothetical protein